MGCCKGRARSVARRPGLTDIPRYAVYLKPPQAMKIQGSDGLLRIRSGDYRIIYSVEDTTRTVLIAAIGHRRDVYRR